MGSQPEEIVWRGDYFNYFTEIERHFQQARGTALFLLSPLDWALIETWKNAGVPLPAVLRGIDAAFEKWRARKHRMQAVNSLAYCSQAVLTEAQAMAGAAPSQPKPSSAPFSLAELESYFAKNSADLHKLSAYEEIAAGLDRIAAQAPALYDDLQQLEQRLTALEDKMIAFARTHQSEEDLFAARRELDRELGPYRGKMSAEQLSMLEKQYLERRLLEAAGLPRLSLFYLR
jgi:hypothetical protein